MDIHHECAVVSVVDQIACEIIVELSLLPSPPTTEHYNTPTKTPFIDHPTIYAKPLCSFINLVYFTKRHHDCTYSVAWKLVIKIVVLYNR